MRRVLYRYSLLLTLLISASPNSHAQLSVAGYTNQTAHGFQLLIEDSSYIVNPTMTTNALNLLEDQLEEITQFCISSAILDSLQAVPIFLDWNTTSGGAQYHPSQAWLIANGYAPEKAKAVEISNATNFFNWCNQNQPYMVLHELAHAYLHRVFNNNVPSLTSAFNNARATGIYNNIQYHAGSGNYLTLDSAYAMVNVLEYFAEISEAYFGLNDYYPFDYDELQSHDSQGFSVLRSIWGNIRIDSTLMQIGNDLVANDNDATAYQWIDCDNGNAAIPGATSQTFSPATNGNYAVELQLHNCSAVSDCYAFNMVALDPSNAKYPGIKAYPVPASNLLNLEWEKQLQEPFSIELVDARGKICWIKGGLLDEESMTIALPNLPDGMYFLRLKGAMGTSTTRIAIQK